MRVASNKLKDLIDFYYSELSALYDRTEIEAIIKLVFEHHLGIHRNEIPMRLNDNVNQSDLLKVYDCCKELTTGKPVQYVLGECWFYNFRFIVNQHVLIPRPETEELVSIIVKENPPTASFIDLGTGSGCIPVSIKCVHPKSKVSACDISNEALDVAKKNAELNKADVSFFETDLLNGEKALKDIEGTFDVIISNPPYIKHSEAKTLSKNVIGFEPHSALFVEGNDDIIFYKKIIDLSNYKLNSSGRLYFELNPLTAQLVHDYAVASGLFLSVELIKDLSGNLRFMKAIKNK
ncbi:MAG: protein-(glutamine-N5) methyltransferase, release factor-specific [Bacteroidetes bacterium]|nr:protein-(glutamine-N5) methyltransferase, release factor-specific [Bacteroidota bacterium]